MNMNRRSFLRSAVSLLGIASIAPSILASPAKAAPSTPRYIQDADGHLYYDDADNLDDLLVGKTLDDLRKTRWYQEALAQDQESRVFVEDLWLPAECKARGCHVQSQYMISNLADGIIHWHNEDGVLRYSAFLMENIFDIQRSPELRGKVAAQLARLAHDPNGQIKRDPLDMISFKVYGDHGYGHVDWEAV